jgi:hypothetical protein
MIRKIGTLGLGIIAVFAMSASPVSASEAADFWAAEDAVSGEISAEGNVVVITPTGAAVTCTAVHGEGEYEGESSSLTESEASITGCHATTFGISFPVTFVVPADCHYTITAGTYTPAEELSHGSVHICEATINVYSNAGHTELRCQIHVPEQTVGNITYRNTTANGQMAVTVEANQVLVSETRTNHGTLGCSSHATDQAKLTGNIIAVATNESGEFVDGTVTGT